MVSYESGIVNIMLHFSERHWRSELFFAIFVLLTDKFTLNFTSCKQFLLS